MKPVALIILFACILNLSWNSGQETGSKISVDMANKALEIHNVERKKLKIPELTWSKELSKYAQAWADQLAKNNCKIQHRPDTPGKWKQLYGENIYWGGGSSLTVINACNAWLKEKKHFKNVTLTSSNWSKSGHYTQMIWKDTKQVGIGIATCKGGEIIVVANYDPAGNFMGEKAY